MSDSMAGFDHGQNDSEQLVANIATPKKVNAGVFNKSDRRVKYSRTLDNFRRYLTDSPTPAKIAGFLRMVDTGDIGVLSELQEEMESKDLHLQSMSQTRQRQFTQLEYDIEPDDKAEDQVLAIESADYVREILTGMDTFDDTLEHLATGIPTNLAVTELIWDSGVLIETVDVPGHRLMGDIHDGPGIFIETDAEPLGVQAFPSKFVVFHSNPRAGFPLRVTLTHATVVPWLIINFARSDWMAFSELYGTPWRIAVMGENFDPKDKEELKDMLENMSTDAAAVVSDLDRIDIIQATGTGETFQNQIAWAEKKLSIGYLGQTLTSDTTGVGSLALGKVHANVRADLTLSDIRREQKVIGRQVIRPMCKLKFPRFNVPCPKFVRKLTEVRDIDTERLNMDQVRLAQELGLPMNTEEAYEKLGITRPENMTQDVVNAKPKEVEDE